MTGVISVYFNGTNDSNNVPKKGAISLAALLHHLTINDGPHNFSICVNGCGESRDIRDFGIVFGFHLKKQVSEITKKIKELLAESEDNIVLNIYGFSRGGIASFLLSKKLKKITPERLTINIASFDPVPVNFIASVNRDMFFGTKSTLSAEVADLTQCLNINNLLILFANYPLPDIMGFAPILPVLPITCNSEIDVTIGRHQTAVSFYKEGDSIQAQNNESVIVFHRIIEFMQKCGTCFDFKRLQLNDNLVYSSDSQKLLNLYEELVKETVDLKPRSMHLHNSILTTANRPYLNAYHQRLCNVNRKPEECVLTVTNHNLQQEQVTQPTAESSCPVMLIPR